MLYNPHPTLPPVQPAAPGFGMRSIAHLIILAPPLTGCAKKSALITIYSKMTSRI